MAEDDMYLANLDAWVCEEKRTITYRWLSNQLAVSSNVAKQMLYAFATKKGDEVQTIYLLSGDKRGHGHTITLVAQSKLADLKREFNSIFSLHVYSVQAVLPKDSAQLWAVDNEQKKELFSQPDNPIATNCWSTLDCPEAHDKRELPAPSAVPQAQVKREPRAQIKTQPKEEAGSSQPSSPEKEKTANKSGRITTSTKKVSPSKKPINTREMTSFFKRAPEEEKTQTLLANAMTGKAKGTSPSKKAIASFFQKKPNSDDNDVEDQENEVKVKKEKHAAGDNDDAELDAPLGDRSSKKRKQDEELEEDMDFERKEDTSKRMRLRKGKRKRADDHGEDESESTEQSVQEPKQAQRKQRQEKEQPTEENDGKRKRRRVAVKQEPEDQNEEEASATDMTTKPSKKTPTKRGRKAQKEPALEAEEENGEKENEDNNAAKNKDDAKRTPKKAAVERKEGVAKTIEPAHAPRRKKRVRRERTYVDDKGFEVTEDVWEEVSDEDTPAPAFTMASIKDEPMNNGETGNAATKKKQTAQANIMSFFGKGKK